MDLQFANRDTRIVELFTNSIQKI